MLASLQPQHVNPNQSNPKFGRLETVKEKSELNFRSQILCCFCFPPYKINPQNLNPITLIKAEDFD